jgi:hypothetical protein
MRDVAQPARIHIEQAITAPLDHALRGKQIDILPRHPEMRCRCRTGRASVRRITSSQANRPYWMLPFKHLVFLFVETAVDVREMLVVDVAPDQYRIALPKAGIVVTGLGQIE